MVAGVAKLKCGHWCNFIVGRYKLHNIRSHHIRESSSQLISSDSSSNVNGQGVQAPSSPGQMKQIVYLNTI